MAKSEKAKTKEKSSKNGAPTSKLKTETKHGIMAIVFFVLALILIMSSFDMAGRAGAIIYKVLEYLLGVGYALLPALFILLGCSFLNSKTPNIGWTRTLSAFLFLLSGLGIIDIASGKHSGGFLGEILSTPLVALFDVYASIVFLGAILIISLLIMFDARIQVGSFFRKLFWKSEENKNQEEEATSAAEEYEEEENEPETQEEYKEIKKEIHGAEEEEEMPIKRRKGTSSSTYVPPPLSLLEEDKGKPNTGDIKANANIIKRTLANFGIEVEMDEITVGPTVTRYALKPAEGVKLSRIVGLQNDLALALAAHRIRIEAPIPGKSLVGIEIPNRSKSIVG